MKAIRCAGFEPRLQLVSNLLRRSYKCEMTASSSELGKKLPQRWVLTCDHADDNLGTAAGGLDSGRIREVIQCQRSVRVADARSRSPPNRPVKRLRPTSTSASSLSSWANCLASASVLAIMGLKPGRMITLSGSRLCTFARDFRSL